MFRLALLSGLVICVTCLSARAGDKPDLVFLLIGQSNMAGRAHLESGDDAVIPGVLLLNADGKWESAKNPLNRYATDRKTISMQRIGPGDGFARRMRELRPKETIGLVVNARGGSNIDLWKPGKHLYDNTLKRINAVPDLKFAGVMWHQGEANANDPDYLAKITDLVANLRRDLKTPELPFVAGQVFKKVPVNEKIAALPSQVPGTAAVGVEKLKVFDGVHFDRASQKTLGARYADAWQKLTETQTGR